MRHHALRSAILTTLVGATGCGLFDTPATGDGGTDPAGFTAPTLELTINGTHFGPSAPDVASSAQLVTTRDSFTQQATYSTFRVNASSAATGAACNIAVERQGDDIATIGVGGYQLLASTGGATQDGTLGPIAGEGVGVPQGSWQCTGNGCDGATLVLTVMDTAHVEGYLAGNFADNTGAAAAQIACSFYLPWSVLQP